MLELCVNFLLIEMITFMLMRLLRVHNSGHLTINAFNVSQFENHIRAVCGLEQPLKISNAKMMNLLGTNY